MRDLKIEMRATAALIPYARNARTHSAAHVDQIAASIIEFGWTNPVLVDEQGGIIAGHGRVLAARKLGRSEMPTITLTGLTPAQKRAYVLADNKLALNAGWDTDMLLGELQSLRADEFDLGIIGFGDDELADIFGEDGADPRIAGPSLAERFGIPPFTVLNAREGWWQNRKAAWISLGIQSEIGRGEMANDRGQSGSARINDAADGQKRYGRKANAIPGGSLWPTVKNGKIMRSDSTGRAIPGTEAKTKRKATSDGPVRVKISAKMARLKFNGCDPEYIRTTCHASCCQSSTHPSGTRIAVLPDEVATLEARGGTVIDGYLQPQNRRCPFKTSADLCGLHETPDKPFGCIASPFTLNANGTLIVRNRYTKLKCYDDGRKIPAYIAFRASLDLIFGAEESARICNRLDAGSGDVYAEMPRASYAKLHTNDATRHEAPDA